MTGRVRSLGLQGIGGYEVSVEVFMSGGLPQFEVVGLPDAAVRESRERVRAAMKNSGLFFPVSRITANLAPADTKKAGTLYDLPILLGMLVGSGQLPELPADAAFFGELSLMGELRPVCGALPMALCAEKVGIKKLFVPAENAREAAFASGVTVYGVPDVLALVGHLRGAAQLSPAVPPALDSETEPLPDFSEVKGQENVKRALEVAAAGGHNVLLVGPPGSGKSMLSKRLPSILPDMTRGEVIESTGIHSVAGLTDREHPVVSHRPFRSPHHTVSAAGLAGGGSNPRPGEISLAHNGVLFMDELPEFSSAALEVLRQPLEDGRVTVSRVSGSFTFPSSFMLICAMNPCKCGWYGHPSGRCRCSAADIQRYQSRISGPLLDRIDIIIEVPALEYEELKSRAPAEPSAAIRERVNAARERQHQRGVVCNARMGAAELREFCSPDAEGDRLLRAAFTAMNLSARSYDRILRVARTIADLDGSGEITAAHIAEAVQYRSFDPGR